MKHSFDDNPSEAYAPLITTATQNHSETTRRAFYASVFRANYCMHPLETCFGKVRFSFKRDFNHAFFERGPNGPKSEFSTLRAERVLWIRKALCDPNAIHVKGYDSRTKTCHHWRRTIIVPEYRYVVVVQPTTGDGHIFITAFVATTEHSFQKLLSSPPW